MDTETTKGTEMETTDYIVDSTDYIEIEDNAGSGPLRRFPDEATYIEWLQAQTPSAR